MSQQAANHPDREILADFGLGKLDSSESVWIEEHLSGCQECCETLLQLKDDTFAGIVRSLPNRNPDHDAMPLLVQSPTNNEGTIDPADNLVQQSESVEGATVLGKPMELSLLPPELVDHPRYRIVERIGRGGMGDVYRAEHRLMNRPVALKLINAQLVNHPQAVERFRREVQAAAQLSHPNIVTAYDAEQAGNVHFLVMEFVSGTDLATLVQQRGPLSVAEACEYVRQAALGLQHAYEKGMVHRDIKPHNLMLSPDGTVRILDFGLAGFTSEATVAAISRNALASGSDSETTDTDKPDAGAFRLISKAAHLTSAGCVMGTPDYISPEQARDAHTADIRSDIYSLGCTLCYLLTGNPPFEADTVLDKLKAHLDQAPPSLDELDNEIPPELAVIVRRMLAKNPDDRFQTPAEVASALAPFADEIPSIPRPPNARSWSRAMKWMLAPLLVFAGVIIYLATDSGVIEIDAKGVDIPGAKVVLLKDGKEYASFDVKATQDFQRIRAGKYEVQLRGAGDDVQMSVWSKRGNTNNWGDAIRLDREPVMLYRGGGMLVHVLRNVKHQAVEKPAPQPGNRVVLDDSKENPKDAERDAETQDVIDAAEDFLAALDEDDPELGHSRLSAFARRAIGQAQFVAGHKANVSRYGSLKNRKLATAFAVVPAAGLPPGRYFTVQFRSTFENAVDQTETVMLNLDEDGKWRANAHAISPAPPPLTPLVEPNVTPMGSTAAPTDYERLQGAWVCIEAVMGNKPLSEETLAATTLTFDHDQVTARGFGSKEFQVKYALGQFREPKWIEFINPDKTADELSVAGLYEIKGDTLRIAFDDADRPRPRDFKPTDQQDHFVGTFQRAANTESKPDRITEQKKRAALDSAQEWLELIDAGNFAEAWDAASKSYKDSIQRDVMDSANKEHFQRLGALKSRTLKSSTYKPRAPRPPAGDFCVIQFITQFTNQRVIETVLLIREADGQWHVSGYFHDDVKSVPTPPPKQRTGLLTNPPKLPPGGLPVGENLIVDPSLEKTPTGELPKGWFAWLDDGPDFKCEVVEGGATGKQSLQISGTGTRGVVFATTIPLDRTKRYSLKGRVKVEGEAGTWAVIKLNYFNTTGWLGVDDRIGAASNDVGWKQLEKTDLADKYPAATLLVPTCHIEGNGTAWFDDLEVIAYDREDLPEDFDAKYGKNNRMK